MKPSYQGKVRDIYYIDSERMIIVSTDRISAFDVVFSDTIPGKGKILNHISCMWFRYIQKKRSLLFSDKTLQEELKFENHFITDDIKQYPSPYCDFRDWENRSMMVYRTKRINFECVVRGYLAGSGWKEYQQKQSICGIPLPSGLQLGSRLPEPIFTPAIKEEQGKHDINVSFEFMSEQIGKELAHRLKHISLSIFKEASIIFDQIGLILCDTKFEFGLKNKKIYLIDEVLTPDSSRFWEKQSYQEGKNLPSYDKQLIRDYLLSIQWDQKPPPPRLPQSLIENTIQKYKEIERRLSSFLE